MITDVTTGFANSHASDIRAGLQSCAFAIGAIASRILQDRSLIHDRRVELGAARALRVLVLTAEFAGQHATGEWTPDEQACLFRFQESHELAFEIAASEPRPVISVRRGSMDRVMPAPLPRFRRQWPYDLGFVELSDLLRAVSQLGQDLVRMLTEQRRAFYLRLELRKLHWTSDSQIGPPLLVRYFDDRTALA
jgi:hypothetical protein